MPSQPLWDSPAVHRTREMALVRSGPQPALRLNNETLALVVIAPLSEVEMIQGQPPHHEGEPGCGNPSLFST
jgi:hypothetical protein